MDEREVERSESRGSEVGCGRCRCRFLSRNGEWMFVYAGENGEEEEKGGKEGKKN